MSLSNPRASAPASVRRILFARPTAALLSPFGSTAAFSTSCCSPLSVIATRGQFAGVHENEVDQIVHRNAAEPFGLKAD
jgi:hypothetical protein